MGRLSNHAVHNEFRQLPRGNRVTAVIQCKNCEMTMARHSTRQADHLNTCEPYRKKIRGNITFERAAIEKPARRQTNIDQFRVSEIEKAKLDKHIVELLLSIDDPISNASYSRLCALVNALQPGYTPPARSTITGALIPTLRDNVAQNVYKRVSGDDYLTVIFNGTTDDDCLSTITVSVRTRWGTFYYCQYKNVEANTATNVTEDMLRLLDNICIGQHRRISGICTDTSTKMRALCRSILAEERFSHLLTIPCNSHSLHLLVQDVCVLPAYANAMKNAHCVINHFRGSKHAYTTLRKLQAELGIMPGLLLACTTQWGSQAAMLAALLRNKDAISRYATGRDDSIPPLQDLYSIVANSSWWDTIADLARILEPIDTILKNLQADVPGLMSVLSDWNSIWQSWSATPPSTSGVTEHALSSIYTRRKFKQLTATHTLAYCLHPATNPSDWPQNARAICVHELQRLVPNSDIVTEFQEYCERAGLYHTDNSMMWSDTDPSQFWFFAPLNSHLRKIAYHLLWSPSTTSAAERMFSISANTLIKSRNRLSPRAVDDMLYIRVNRQVLQQSRDRFRRVGEAWPETNTNMDVGNDDDDSDDDSDGDGLDNAQRDLVDAEDDLALRWFGRGM